MYFTVEEFRAKTGDTKSPPKFGDDDVLDAHADVVERLEDWARTAWEERTTVLDTYRYEPQLILKKVPVISVDSLVLDGYEALVDDYILDITSGILRWDDWSFGMPSYAIPAHVVLTYTYGFEAVPTWLKNACIKAARSLMMGEEGRSKVPGNVSTYGTERAQVQFRADRGLIRPWPWDERQSQYVRSAWEQHRPKAYMTA